ncbi:ATP-binding cassette transporter snq2 [Dimargaris xerosporica]|nr:ATP-binding cassette transporter snq2 [Dimargaris xerosporica]
MAAHDPAESRRVELIRRYHPTFHTDYPASPAPATPLSTAQTSAHPTTTLSSPARQWRVFAECPTPAGPQAFLQVMEQWIQNPNLVLPPVARAEIAQDNCLGLATAPAMGPSTQALLAHPSMSLIRHTTRRLLPKRTTHDAIVTEQVLVYQSPAECRVEFSPCVAHDEQGLADLPFYYPKFASFAYTYCVHPLAQPSDTSDDVDRGLLRIEFFMPSQQSITLTAKEEYVWQQLLRKLHKWCIAAMTGYRKRGQHDQLVTKDQYLAMYRQMKADYGATWVSVWPEKTDAAKFIYEDIGIASWLLCLWQQRMPSTAQNTGARTFMDLGCGNGFLVHLLASKGYHGWGLDQADRKVWQMYGPGTHLIAETLYPMAARYPDTEWFIGNHADELVPWIPIIAARSHYHAKIVVIPCCLYELSGEKYNHTQPGRTRYQVYLDYIAQIMEICGFIVEREQLRIPSTKNIALVGRQRTFNQKDTEQRKRVLQAIDALVAKVSHFSPRDAGDGPAIWRRFHRYPSNPKAESIQFADEGMPAEVRAKPLAGASTTNSPIANVMRVTPCSMYIFPNTLGDTGTVAFGEPTQVSYRDATAAYREAGGEGAPAQEGEADWNQAHSSVDQGRSLEKGEPLYDIREGLAQHVNNIDRQKLKELGLVFDNISVYGKGTAQQSIATVPTPLIHMAIDIPILAWRILTCHSLKGTSNTVTKTILHNVSGFVRTGEMLLVLGKPGAGCSTLLRVLGNQRKSYTNITGDISYGGLTPEEMRKHYRGEVVYNQEEDYHFATISVRDTISFALKSKTPSTRVLSNRSARTNKMTDALLRMFGLKRCADTRVGNAMLRGVSGGEKKRTSIAEQMATSAAITMWDGSTKGLDASSALDYVKSLRIVADLLHRTTVVTLYQASENIYNVFDKVMVLAEGRCIYFGPAQEVKAYFQSLGYVCPDRQTTSDFLTGITSEHEARVTKGMEDQVPRTAKEFEDRFCNSYAHGRLMQDIEQYRQELQETEPAQMFRQTINGVKMGAGKKTYRAKSPYQTTYWFQVIACLQRETKVILGNPTTLLFRLTYNACMAIIVGSLFFQLPDTSDGAFPRGGVLFFALLFNTLVAQSEIPKCFQNRPVIYKQKAYAFYHPSANYLAQMLTDLPITLVQVVVFSSILYWMASLQSGAGKFIIFILIVFMSTLCLTALFRLVGNATVDLDMAHMVSGLALLVFIVLTGYLIPPKSMGGWVLWIFWINPIAYGLKALVSNEFKGLVIRCSPTSLVPSGAPQYNNIQNQVCTLAGARPGTDIIRGEDYIRESFGFKSSNLWPDFIAVCCFYLLFLVLALIVVETVEFGGSGYSTNVFKTRRRSPLGWLCCTSSRRRRYRRNAPVDPGTQTRPNQAESGGMESDAVVKDASNGLTLTWQDISYTVSSKHGDTQLLHSINGYVRPGAMTALMGSSGAGKTTLLDVLALRKNLGKVDGDILLSGEILTKTTRRQTGYCEQMDIHDPYTTVREALQFSAYLRQPAHVSKPEKDAFVEKVIQLLEMEEIADAMVGSTESGIGISVEERKRLTIAVELVAKPKVLFLDEPTSGLDAQASFSIVRFLRKLAAEGQTMLCTIHQPSSLLFEQFDRLLLLAPGGHTAYFGDLGDGAQNLIDYFESHGAPKCPPTANPAEWMLDVIGTRSEIDWPDVWNNSSNAQQLRQDLIQVVDQEQTSRQGHADDPENCKEYALHYPAQCRIVLKRIFRSYWRDPAYNCSRILLQAFSSFFLAITYIQLGDGTTDLQNRTFAIFQISVLGILVINQVQPQVAKYRTWFTREEASGFYDWRAFATGMILAEIPYAIFAATVFFSIFYWAVGLSSIGSRVGYFYLMYITLTMFAVYLGQAIAAWTPNDVFASLVNPIFASFMALFCGVTIPYQEMPAFWRRWVYWIDPYHYVIEGIMVNDLYGRKVTCEDDELHSFRPPSGQTCGEYTQAFFTRAKGYLDDPSSSTQCRYCPYSYGEDYYEPLLDWSFVHRYRNFLIMLGFIVFNLSVLLLGFKFYRPNKR